MCKKLMSLAQEKWETIPRKALMIQIGREDWMFEICRLYQKGEIQVYLCPVPTPGTRFSQLKPLTKNDWKLATSKAHEILAPVNRHEKNLTCPTSLSPSTYLGSRGFNLDNLSSLAKSKGGIGGEGVPARARSPEDSSSEMRSFTCSESGKGGD